MFTKLDDKQLSTINGGVRQGPNGESCTERPGRPGSPRPRPGQNPILGGNQQG